MSNTIPPPPDIFVIGRAGKMGDPNERYRLMHKLGKTQVVATRGGKRIKSIEKNNNNMTSFLKSEHKDLDEVYKSDLDDEYITYDLQYFLTFCSLLYLIRAIHLTSVIYETVYVNHKTTFTGFGLILFLAQIMFILVMLSVSVTGFIFCWLQCLSYAFLFLISVFLSTLLLDFRLITQIVELYKNFKFSDYGYSYDRTWASIFDVMFLVINLIIGFTVGLLYKEISQSKRIFEFEPNFITINGLSLVSSAICADIEDNYENKLFTNPSKVDSDVYSVDNSLGQVKELLEKLDAKQFIDLNELVNKIQTDLRKAKHQFDLDNDFDKLGQKVQDLKHELNLFAPKLRSDLEKFSRKH
ncbi:uncharacterized protein LOC128964164 [Oppia nitens]|uniref:uncharacterized protein LOC128964164 n=1 Tax=Oppia nitens TaxID=1686743 RepID=UPI0023DACCAF|nr:uncharacterized protein LOC128964164 [Oppia nitens]